VAVESSAAVYVITHCCGSHSAVIGSRSVRPPHTDPRTHPGLPLSYPAFPSSLCRCVIAQYDRHEHHLFVRAGPVHRLCLPASFVLFLDHSTYRCARCEVVEVSFCLQPSHPLASLAANRCCLELMATGIDVSRESVMSGPSGVVGRAPTVDLPCEFRRS
jgi:hypothetical protein